tara:strand:+ start:87 stop:239 length:153 start_codon:yes stop_codon:yes gene_type:complete
VVKLRSLVVHIAQSILPLPICNENAQQPKYQLEREKSGGGVHRRFFFSIM